MTEPAAPVTLDPPTTRSLSSCARTRGAPCGTLPRGLISPWRRSPGALLVLSRLASSSAITQINYGRISTYLEAVTELRFAGDLDLAHITQFAAEIPEVQEVLTVAGDPDALVRVRVNGIDHLQKVVNRLRTGGGVTGTKTLVVLDSWIRRA